MYRLGVWGSDKEYGSSNFKELDNFVCTLEGMKDNEDDFCGVELFIITGKTVAEGVKFKRFSISKKLCNFVLRSNILEIEC